MSDHAPETKYLKNYKAPPYQVEQIDLVFQLFEDKTIVHAQTRFRRDPGGAALPLFLNGEHQTLASVALDGKALKEGVDFQKTDKGLTLPAPQGLEFTLDIETILHPHQNTALEGLYVSGGNYCTQCEAEGFRRITYYPDRPDVMGVFTVRIEADKEKYPVLLSNGNLEKSGDLGNGRHFAVWHDPFPKPCYLFALVAGDLVHIQDSFTTCSGRSVDLRIYVRTGDENQCRHAMDSLKRAMAWDEAVYGREYDLDIFNIVAVSDFNMGAMENKSLNIFNTSCILAHPETATDTDFLHVESVVAHEYFHNWSGNRVTCRDWFQLSLKEGFTVFRDEEFSADMNSRAVQRIDDVNLLRRIQFTEDSSPLAHPVRPESYIEINNFYTATVYEKGAELIRMMRTIVGAESYRKGTDLYFERHDGQAVTCEDFVRAIEDAAQADLSQFRLWYSQAGTPEIAAQGHYDAESKRYTLDLAQHIPPTPGQPHKNPMHIPLVIGLVGPDGRDMATELLHLHDAKHSFVFENIPARPVPSLLRGFSAPVKLKSDLSDADLRFLVVHDCDGFNRWESMQILALRMMGRMLDAAESGGDMPTDPAFIDAFSALLGQDEAPDADRLLLARLMTLPDISIIGQQRRHIDPAAIFRVRSAVLGDLVTLARDKLLALYARNHLPTERTDAEAIARRALKNAALAALVWDPQGAPVALFKDQYDTAANMTDRAVALALLCQSAEGARDAALGDFHARFKAFPLVIDKWFAIQSAAIREDTLTRVQALRGHGDFVLTNPNRVRALYGAFANGNPVCFHAPDGGGYDFLAGAILELNAVNPQIASRLLIPLREWRHYTPDRQEKARISLERIANAPNLSPDVYEVVTKILA